MSEANEKGPLLDNNEVTGATSIFRGFHILKICLKVSAEQIKLTKHKLK